MFSQNKYKRGGTVSEIPFKYNHLKKLLELIHAEHQLTDSIIHGVISRNPNLTWEIVHEHKDRPWDRTQFYKNANMFTFEKAMQKDTEYYLCPAIIHSHVNPLLVTPAEYQEYERKYWQARYSWDCFSENTNITPEIIKKNLKMPWNWRKLLQNPNMTWEFVRYVIRSKSVYWRGWNWYELSKNPNVVRENPSPFGNLWDLQGLLRNPNITPEIFDMYGIDFTNDCSDPYATGVLPNRKDLLSSSEVSLNIVWKYPNEDWDWGELSHNPGITRKNIRENPDKKWDRYNMCMNPNLTWHDFENVPKDGKFWRNFGTNPNLTWKRIYENWNEIIAEFLLSHVLQNTFGYKYNMTPREIRKYMAGPR